MSANNTEIEKRLWDAADELRANSRLKASEYSVPVLGLIFLRYADHKFAQADREIKAERAEVTAHRQRPITTDDYHARGVLYLPDEARFQYLVQLPEGENIGRAIEDAGLEEIPRMERGLGWLATLARITPLIGLLGTVLGMMDMLLEANRNAPLVQSADLTGGLWAALSATALSLVIAILAYAGYNLLVSRVESILLDMERSASALMNFMRQWKKNREDAPA